MPSPATAARGALKTILTNEFTDLAFVGGVRDDRMHASLGQDGNYAATYPESEEAVFGQELDQRTILRVQVFGQWTPEVDPSQAADPALPEGWANRFKRAVKAAATPGTQMVWFFKLTRIEYTPDPTGNITRFIATVEARGNNPALTETTA